MCSTDPGIEGVCVWGGGGGGGMCVCSYPGIPCMERGYASLPFP